MFINNTPIIVGASQYTQYKDSDLLLDPLSLISKTSQEAIKDSGASDIIDFIDAIYMVNINSWSYRDAPGELSKLLKITPKEKVYLPDGGNTPQMLANRAANAIGTLKHRAILITGGESLYSRLKARKRAIDLNWPKKETPDYMEGEIWDGTNAFENKYGLKYPPYSYAILETALRASLGRSIEEHKLYMGKLFERFSKVASQNPYSWNKESYSADEIIKVHQKNRYIAHPYTKRMCSNLFVNQSGSIIMTSENIAKKLNIDKKKWVYLMGGADLSNIHDITRRPRLYDSPAAREGSQLALQQAGLSLNNINKFDIYSCFPSIVEIIMNEIGLSEDDPRGLTLTGGLPYFGGPWSNYSLHSIITAANLIRNDPSLKIMIVANGGYNSKQSFGIYGMDPPTYPWCHRDDTIIQQSILSDILPEPVEKANGNLKVDGYTITYDRKGQPEKGIIIGILESGRRSLALIKTDSKKLLELEQTELIGKKFSIRHDKDIDYNIVDI
ncbi:MAG: hypothetical protein ACFE85_10195 [Candidatus Hodarchaeota archaeon]